MKTCLNDSMAYAKTLNRQFRVRDPDLPQKKKEVLHTGSWEEEEDAQTNLPLWESRRA